MTRIAPIGFDLGDRTTSACLRLFHAAEPSRQLDERQLEEGGELVIGRGGDADWSLEDPGGIVSRRHCSISVKAGAVTLTDLSANGVFLGVDQDRAPRLTRVMLRLGETVGIGDYRIVIEAAERSAQPATRVADVPFLRRDPEPPPAQPPTREGADAPMTLPPQPDLSTSDPGALLDAFCAGAGLDVTAFADEDPATIMLRLGGVYQQMVAGLAEVMRERTAIKSEYLMDHTTVRPAGNNPFRWANADRIAVDLLGDGHDGFLAGPPAVRAAFADVKTHVACLFAGLKAALDATLEDLSPSAIEARAGRSALLGRSDAAAWREYIRTHKRCQTETHEDPEGLATRAFRGGYARRLQELGGG